MSAAKKAGSMTESLKRKLVTANHVLANEGIIQGFGHVSVRDPETDTVLLSQSRSPAFVTEDDVLELTLDGEVLDDELDVDELEELEDPPDPPLEHPATPAVSATPPAAPIFFRTSLRPSPVMTSRAMAAVHFPHTYNYRNNVG